MNNKELDELGLNITELYGMINLDDMVLYNNSKTKDLPPIHEREYENCQSALKWYFTIKKARFVDTMTEIRVLTNLANCFYELEKCIFDIINRDWNFPNSIDKKALAHAILVGFEISSKEIIKSNIMNGEENYDEIGLNVAKYYLFKELEYQVYKHHFDKNTETNNQ